MNVQVADGRIAAVGPIAVHGARHDAHAFEATGLKEITSPLSQTSATSVSMASPCAKRPSPVMVWTPEQTKVFLEYARSHRMYAQYHLIAFRGLRRGESWGLRWGDLNLKEGTMTVRWQITQIVGGTEQGKPKSDAGDRQIMLDQHTLTELLAHKTRQNTERLATGESWTDSGFVFTTETGQPLHPMQVSDQFLRLAMAAGLPPIRLHDLRHGAATILLRAGHDLKVVQETLGLSSISIAADTYTSVLPDLARQSAEDAAAVIIGAANANQRA